MSTEPESTTHALSTSVKYAGQRLLRRGKYLLGHDPLTLPILLRLTPMGISRQITDCTDLVVEGFPRAGNTFTVTALMNASHSNLRIASHCHHPAQVKKAALLGVPTVLVVRDPLATLSSYLTFGRHGRPGAVIREYISYHRELCHYVDRLVLCEFDESINDLSSVIARINFRFGLDIPPFDQSAENTERVFDEIARYHALVHRKRDPAEVVPRPAANRARTSDRWRAELSSPTLKARMDQANDLFAYFAWKAQQQRAIFERARESARRTRESDRARDRDRPAKHSTGRSPTSTPSIHQ